MARQPPVVCLLATAANPLGAPRKTREKKKKGEIPVLVLVGNMAQQPRAKETLEDGSGRVRGAPGFQCQGQYPPHPSKNRGSRVHVLTSANLVPCPHQPLAAWTMIKEQFTAFCLSLLPWLGPLVYRDGVTPPLNPGRPPERPGESTRTPLISPEKPALPRPARGAPLASSLAGFFRETGGQ